MQNSAFDNPSFQNNVRSSAFDDPSFQNNVKSIPPMNTISNGALNSSIHDVQVNSNDAVPNATIHDVSVNYSNNALNTTYDGSNGGNEQLGLYNSDPFNYSSYLAEESENSQFPKIFTTL